MKRLLAVAVLCVATLASAEIRVSVQSGRVAVAG